MPDLSQYRQFKKCSHQDIACIKYRKGTHPLLYCGICPRQDGQLRPDDLRWRDVPKSKRREAEKL